jgi:hypothetical protein
MIFHNLADSKMQHRKPTRMTIICPTSASSSFLSIMLKEKGVAPINAEIVQDNAKPKQAPPSTIRRSRSAEDQPCNCSRVASDKFLGPYVLQPRRQQRGNSSSRLSSSLPSGIPLRRGASDISLPLMPKRTPSPSRSRTRAQQTPTSNVSKNASWDNVDLSQMSNKKVASKETVLSVLLNSSSTKTSGSVKGHRPSFSAYNVVDAIGSPTSSSMPRKTLVVGTSSSKKLLLDRWGNSSSTSRLANILLQPSSSSSSMGSPLRQKSRKLPSHRDEERLLLVG